VYYDHDSLKHITCFDKDKITGDYISYIGECYFFWNTAVSKNELGLDNEWLAQASYIDRQIASGAPGFCSECDRSMHNV
jgi:hypothetical protein